MTEETGPCMLYREKWYRWSRFPLLPCFKYKPGNEFNKPDFSFHWLIIRCWSLMSPDIGAEFELCDQGFSMYIRIPYIKIGINIPLFPWRWHQKLWRVKRNGY